MRVQRRWGWVIALGWIATASAAQEKANIYLVQAKVFYQGMEFEKCLQRLEQAGRSSQLSQRDLAEVELYLGLCGYNVGQRDEAETHFRQALQLNPELGLPPATSPRIAEVFEPIARQVRDAQAASQADAPRDVQLAPTQDLSTRTDLVASPERQGSKVLPIALGGTTVAAAGLAAVFGVMANGHAAQANDPATYHGDAVALGNTARREATIANVCLGVAGAAAIGAVVTWFTAQ